MNLDTLTNAASVVFNKVVDLIKNSWLNFKESIARVSSDSVEWVGILALHGATVPALLGLMTGITDNDFFYHDIPRDDPYLVQIIKEMGKDADGTYANLKIVEIPGDVDWEIGEYDGREWVAEKHRTWS